MSEFQTFYQSLTAEVSRLRAVVNREQAELENALTISPSAADAVLGKIACQLEKCMDAHDKLESRFGWGEHYDTFFQFQDLPTDAQEEIRTRISKLSRRYRTRQAIRH